jgi:hypothetical protein
MRYAVVCESKLIKFESYQETLSFLKSVPHHGYSVFWEAEDKDGYYSMPSSKIHDDLVCLKNENGLNL